AIIGRSNAGKSSLINHLTQKKNLVYVSSTPGKTQLINFFLVDNKLMLVDLPGYGFAKVDRELRKSWGEVLASYLEYRPQLKLLILVLDSRRDPSEEDKGMIAWAQSQQKQLLFIFSKIDKLNNSEKKQSEIRIINSLSELMQNQTIHYILYSIKDNQCRINLQNKISFLLSTYQGNHGTT
ncbi:MAG: YihA family ribosome biogenesis GTP-binding protein, partial [Verrucomicrobia bacterium]|nr:YihA family ribosome biogenesis GTP-binding protein [Verrucomicrobiota bacterium]